MPDRAALMEWGRQYLDEEDPQRPNRAELIRWGQSQGQQPAEAAEPSFLQHITTSIIGSGTHHVTRNIARERRRKEMGIKPVKTLEDAILRNAAGGDPQTRGEQRNQYVMDRIPFSPTSAVYLTQLTQAANRYRSGARDDATLAMLAEAFNEAQRNADKGWARKFTDLVTSLPKTGIEFFATGGAYTGAKKGVEKLVGEGVKKTIAGKAATGIASRTAGVTAQTAMMPHMITESVVRRMAPEFQLSQDDAGRLSAILNRPDESFEKAVGLGSLDALIEIMSERSGGVIARATGARWLKAAVAKRFMSKGKTVGQLQKLLDRAQWHGVIGEIGEERVGDIARGVTGVEKDYGVTGALVADPLSPEAWEQLSIEAAAFAVPGAAMTVGGAIGDKLAAIDRRIEEGGAPTRKEAEQLGFPPGDARSLPKRRNWYLKNRDRLKEQGRAETPEDVSTAEDSGLADLVSATAIPPAEAEVPGELEPGAGPVGIPEVQGEPVRPEVVPEPEAAGPQPEGREGVDLSSEIASIKNAVVDDLRAGRNLPAMETDSPESQQDWLDSASERWAADRDWPDNLIAELEKSPRNLDRVEVAGLQLRYRDLNNRLERASGAMAEAEETMDAAGAIEAQSETELVYGQMQRMEEATKAAGTAWGRAGVARQIELREDFSRGALVRKARVAKGETLTAKDVAELDEMAAKNASLQEQLEAMTAEKEAAERNRAVDEKLSKVIGVRKKKPGRRSAARKKVNEALAEFRKVSLAVAKGTSPTMAGIPVDLINAAGKVVSTYVELGYVTLAEVLADVRSSLGSLTDRDRAVLSNAWRDAREAGQIETPKVNADDYSEVSKLAQQIMRHVVESGVREREAVVDAVHEELSAIAPGTGRRQTMDAMSDYGQYAPLSKDEISVEIRDIKGQLRQLSRLEDMAVGKAPLKTGWERPAPSKKEQDLIQQVNEAKRRGGFEGSNQAYERQLRKRLADYEERITKGDFAPRKRPEKKYGKEITRLQFEQQEIRDKFRDMQRAWLRKQRPLPLKALAVIPEGMNFSRSLITSFDISAPGRQGWLAVLSHPVISVKATGPMFKAITKKGAFAAARNLKNRDNFVLYKQVRLGLTELGGSFTKQEEAYMGRWARHFPGISHSERLYVTFLNQVRADVFDALLASMAKRGKVDPNQARVIANYVNVITGRGPLGATWLEPAATTLAHAFFSPRWVLSRIQFLALQPLYRGDLQTKRLIAKEYAKIAVGVGLMYATVQLATALLFDDDDEDKPTIETDPRSGDFGKVRIGNTRIDPLAGLLQTIVLASRIGSGGLKRSSGKVAGLRDQYVLGDHKVPYGGSRVPDVFWQFVRMKFSPVVSAPFDFWAGENVVYEEWTPKMAAANLAWPMAFRDVAEAMKEHGVPAGAALGLLAIWGVGLNTYEPKPKKKTKTRTILLSPEESRQTVSP